MKHSLDLRGMIIPFTMLKLSNGFRKMRVGEILEIIVANPDARKYILEILATLDCEVLGVHEGKEVRLEQWYSDEERIIALKTPDGELGFSDYNKGKRYIYDPDTKEISISFIEQSDYSKNETHLYLFA